MYIELGRNEVEENEKAGVQFIYAGRPAKVGSARFVLGGSSMNQIADI